MNLPSKSLTFKIDENEYTVNYPNNGQFIAIESMKSSLTSDNYEALASRGSISSQYARYTVDMIAFFSNCCPQLKKDLKVETFSQLDMIDSKKLIKVYASKILPWLVKWEEVLNSDEEEETVAKTDEEPK